MKDKNSLLLSLFFLLQTPLFLEAFFLQLNFMPYPQRTWNQARDECKKHADLMNMQMMQELRVRGWMHVTRVPSIWISERRDPANPTSWRATSVWSEEQTWAEKDEECAYFSRRDGKKHGPCSSKHKVACIADNLLLVTENKTWEGALQHCKDMETKCAAKSNNNQCSFTFDLLIPDDPSEFNYLRSRINHLKTDEVWIGLRFIGGHWLWLNGQSPEDEGALPHCPSKRESCGTLSKHNNYPWITRDCSEKRNFICVMTPL